mgnify:FL=1|jgi:hypothetical protein
MQTIQILIEKGLPTVIIDGKKFDRLHSFSLDYVKGAPLLFSCVADIGESRREGPKILH